MARDVSRIPTVEELNKNTCSENALLMLRLLNTTDGITHFREVLKVETLGDIVHQSSELMKIDMLGHEPGEFTSIGEAMIPEAQTILDEVHRRVKYPGGH